MDQAAIDKAAALLIRARRTREPLARLPEDCRPATLPDALRIQAATVEQMDETVAGWKVGGMIEGALSYGVLLASRLVPSGGKVEARDMPLLGMEAEIAFRCLRDAPPREAAYTYDEVSERVVACAAIEIVATRYRDYKGTPLIERVADCMSNGAFVTGDEKPGWRSLDLKKIPVSLAFGDDVVARSVGGHAAGDPLRPAVDLVNALRAGGGVRAGQLVTTGTYTGLHFATPGVHVRAAFEGFGGAEVEVL
ncbi:MAG TPA: 2-keto-4-pentenoate hydratase [Casimicrobiaceae bacterium]